MNNLKVILAVGFAIGLVSLAGCAGKTRYPSYYVLNLPAPVTPSVQPAPKLGTAGVREFRAPGRSVRASSADIGDGGCPGV